MSIGIKNHWYRCRHHGVEGEAMKIAIASGKGGTGKTTVAVNFAMSLTNAQLLDCDVEEPNANVFLHAPFQQHSVVTVSIPDIDEKTCTYCGKCADFCAYNALAVVSKQVLLFPELCHACKGCELVCPVDAIGWKKRTVGIIHKGKTDAGIDVIEGELNLGETMAVPVIKALKKEIENDKTIIIDAPPGTSCPVIEAMQDADYVILVTEPTPFGHHDLKLAVDVVRRLKKHFGVIINRDGIGDNKVDLFCQQNEIPILLRIPHDTNIAHWYSNGEPFVVHRPEMKKTFLQVLEHISLEVQS
jgi:MinD superfamily P-loop ATPase